MKDEGIQQQNFSEQYRYENWFKRDINRDHKKLIPLDKSNTVISAARHDPIGTSIPHNLKMLTKKHNDKKLAITLLIVGTGLIAYHFW